MLYVTKICTIKRAASKGSTTMLKPRMVGEKHYEHTLLKKLQNVYSYS